MEECGVKKWGLIVANVLMVVMFLVVWRYLFVMSEDGEWLGPFVVSQLFWVCLMIDGLINLVLGLAWFCTSL